MNKLKKLILNSGLTTLSILPIVVIASCSSTTGNDSTLTTEIAKFEKSFELKKEVKNISINAANNSINLAAAGQAKWEALGTLVDLPKKSKEFIYDVKSSSIDSTASSLKVLITINQINVDESKNLVMTITGFNTTSSPALTSEVEKYKSPFNVKDSARTMTVFTAIESINKATETSKISVLGNLINLPQMNNAFTYRVGLARSIPGNENSFIAPLTITEIATPTITETVEVKITGLSTLSAFEKEIAKFQTSLPANAASRTKETTVIEREISNSSDKEKTLRSIVDSFPTVSSGYSLIIGTASLNLTSVTSVNVSITVIQQSDNASKSTTLVITGLKEETSLLVNESRKFTTTLGTTWKTDPTTAVKTINETNGNEMKLNLLKQHIKSFPEIANGFSLTVGEAKLIANQFSSITIALKVIRNSDKEARDATLTITGFNLPQEAINVEVAKLTDKRVLVGKSKETAIQAVARINATTLVEYYAKVPLSDGFSYAWKSNEVIGDTVKVIVTVSSTHVGIKPVEHSFIISGFSSLLDLEAEKFRINILTNNGANTPTQVIKGINDANGQAAKLAKLKSFIRESDFPTLDSNFTLEVGLASSSTFSNAANVAIKIIEKSSKKEKVVTLTIVGLTIEA